MISVSIVSNKASDLAREPYPPSETQNLLVTVFSRQLSSCLLDGLLEVLGGALRLPAALAGKVAEAPPWLSLSLSDRLRRSKSLRYSFRSALGLPATLSGKMAESSPWFWGPS